MNYFIDSEKGKNGNWSAKRKMCFRCALLSLLSFLDHGGWLDKYAGADDKKTFFLKRQITLETTVESNRCTKRFIAQQCMQYAVRTQTRQWPKP